MDKTNKQQEKHVLCAGHVDVEGVMEDAAPTAPAHKCRWLGRSRKFPIFKAFYTVIHV